MKFIANINGTRVYAIKSKIMSAIVDTLVRFSDGSWCDVSTGQVFGAGIRLEGGGHRQGRSIRSASRGNPVLDGIDDACVVTGKDNVVVRNGGVAARRVSESVIITGSGRVGVSHGSVTIVSGHRRRRGS